MANNYIGIVTINTSMPEPVGYNKTTLFGEQYTDYIWTIKKIASSVEIDNTRPYNYKPSWSEDTVLLANFDNTLNGGSIETLNENIISWSIYRKKTDETKLDLVASIDGTKDFIIDYNVANQTEYQYYIFPETENTVGDPMISDSVTTNWWNWSLIDIKKSNTENLYYVDIDNIWTFDLSIDSGSMTQNLDKQIYLGFTQFPKSSTGNRDFLSGQLNCLIGKVKNANYTDTIKMQSDFRNCIKNGNEKILKDRKGNIFLIDTTGNSFSTMDIVKEQAVTIGFTWNQIGDTKNISIVEEIL